MVVNIHRSIGVGGWPLVDSCGRGMGKGWVRGRDGRGLRSGNWKEMGEG